MKTPKSNPETPVLVIRWISEKKERDEVAEIKAGLGPHYPVRAVRARTKDEVYVAFEPWLKTSSARILYIGAHGTKAGLVDRRKDHLELMKWEQLGKHLASVPSAFQYPVVLVLGACYSSLAPLAWTKLELRIPVSHVICIANEPQVKDVVQMIVQILRNDRGDEQLLSGSEQEITYLDESISALRGSLPSTLKLRLFVRGGRSNGNKYAFEELKHLGEQPELQRELEKCASRRKLSALCSAIQEGVAEPVPSKAALEEKRACAQVLNRIALDDNNDLQPSRALPGRDLREQKRKRSAIMAVSHRRS
jgi:hypothetical protein